jgi:outer membrane protein OmpA-like peptidoglycan-associated protein
MTKTENALLTVVLAAVLCACQTVDPYTGEQKTSKATTGALIGAAAGAAVGAISGDDNRERRKRAAIGAGVGALAGGAVGHYMDRQEAELRKRLADTGVSVTRKGNQVILNMPGNITFDTNRSEINANFFPVLDSVAEVLHEYDKTLVEVVGHTDSTGSDAINQPLSQRRADSVVAYLRSHGVVPARLSAYGVSSNYPIASNATAEGRALNRRVEIALLPLTS